ncbi:MBL fold metallo-hydrolase [Mesorhizobium sp.]|uniref:MBL fold metallo-hydrolase n=1 Tax=Mesorhizobium sp. TaxID=1871066 RepID=UPI0025E0D441|nr:MBL fold metallo-hydrolase [Mesorhizobium sp.]
MPRKPATRKKRQAGAAATPQHAPAVTIRHYCQGIGDCHLLSFKKPNGPPFRMLIDCGVHVSIKGGAALVGNIVADLKKETGGKIDVLVVTHEHWDHVSGFLTSNALFKDFSVGEVWMAWTENADDPQAAELDKFKAQALSALQGVSQKLEAASALTQYMAGLHDGLQAVLGFQFGAAGERVRAARDAAAKLSSKPVLYFEPGGPLPSIGDMPNLRIYVLGPPRDKAALQLEEKASEMYPLATGGAFARALKAGLAVNETDDGSYLDELSPFKSGIGTPLSVALDGADGEKAKRGVETFIRKHYSGPVFGPSSNEDPDQSWRRIDADWMGIAADLALQLDRGVNNTSLVLAFELVDSGRVFLFPGDAQIGNWLSWKDLKWPVGQATVTAADLLARTVYLKVAHHGSQNATPNKQGLDLMISPDLSAFIPTNKLDALNVHWGEMPYDAILTALEAKTKGRVIRADDAWLADANGKPAFTAPSGSIQAVRSAPRDAARGAGGLWVEVDVS